MAHSRRKTTKPKGKALTRDGRAPESWRHKSPRRMAKARAAMLRSRGWSWTKGHTRKGKRVRGYWSKR